MITIQDDWFETHPMNTAKELAQITQARKARDSQMFYARQYAGPWAYLGHHKPGVAKRSVKQHVTAARKTNRKLVTLLRTGSLRPVTVVMEALKPLIEAARTGAIEYAQERVAEVAKKLEENHGNVNAFAPEQSHATEHDRRKRFERDVKREYRAFVLSITKATVAKQDGHYEPQAEREAREAIRMLDPEGVERFIKNCIEGAEYNYLEFVFKMDKKVGAVKAARLHRETNSVWGWSFLIVTKDDGSEIIWKTQQITNRSKRGKYFPQWPSRIVKEIQ